jgi:hypothetical protein
MEGLAILIALLFFVQIRWLYQGGKIDQIEWDVATVTVGDFSVEWKVSRDAYETWDKAREEFGQSNEEMGKSEGLLFK